MAPVADYVMLLKIATLRKWACPLPTVARAVGSCNATVARCRGTATQLLKSPHICWTTTSNDNTHNNLTQCQGFLRGNSVTSPIFSITLHMGYARTLCDAMEGHYSINYSIRHLLCIEITCVSMEFWCTSTDEYCMNTSSSLDTTAARCASTWWAMTSIWRHADVTSRRHSFRTTRHLATYLYHRWWQLNVFTCLLNM